MGVHGVGPVKGRTIPIYSVRWRANDMLNHEKLGVCDRLASDMHTVPNKNAQPSEIYMDTCIFERSRPCAHCVANFCRRAGRSDLLVKYGDNVGRLEDLCMAYDVSVEQTNTETTSPEQNSSI